MLRNTEPRDQAKQGAAVEQAGPLPTFLADLANSNLGEYVVVHTGQHTYMGKLLSVTPACITLHIDSESFDQPMRLRIDTTRVEAIEVLPD